VKKTLPRLIENRPNEFFKRAERVLILVQGWSKTSPSRPLRITGRLVNINPNPTLTLTLEFSAGSVKKTLSRLIEVSDKVMRVGPLAG
jgi:hypothetical protein